MKHFKIIFSLSLLFSSLFGVAQNCNIVPGKVVKKLQKARLENNFDKKLSLLNKVLAKNPNEASVYFELAETYMQQGNISLRTQSSLTEGEQLLKKSCILLSNFNSKMCRLYAQKLLQPRQYFLFYEKRQGGTVLL